MSPLVLASKAAKRLHPSHGLVRRPLRLMCGLLAAVTLSGCVFFPRSTPSYTGDCEIVEQRLTLDSVPVRLGSAGCSGEACMLVLALYGGVTAGTAVVSGSVVLIGNTLYWLEKKGRCSMPVVARATSEFLRDPSLWRVSPEAASSAPDQLPVAGE